MKISFSPPDISDLEVDEVSKALKSGWITTGPRTKELEKKIAEWVGVGFSSNGTPKCVCLNSQTACAEMALRLLGIGVGDEVIVPAYTYTASASVVCHVGAKPILIDSQNVCLEMDYEALEKAINKRTKAIIPVDLGGIPCDYDRIFSIVEKKKKIFRPKTSIQKSIGRIAVLADTAHAFGAMIGEKMVGNIADFSSFSFHAVKNLTTGEGGALTWKHIDGVDDDELYHQLQLFSLHGQSKDALKKNLPGEWEYDIVGTWYKCNMTDIVAAVGLKQFERYPNMLKRRKEIIERYDKAFHKLGVITLNHYTTSYTSSGHLYITRVPNISDEQRRKIIVEMAERGVSCNVHYKPLPMHTAYKNMGYNIKDFPNSYKHYVNEITLPLHTCLTDEEVDYIIKNYIEVLKEYVD